MLHPFGTDQFIRQPLDLGGRTTHDNNFQAMMGVEVNMECGDDGVMM
jgi:hypothetical protein